MNKLILTVRDIKELRSIINVVLAYTTISIDSFTVDFVTNRYTITIVAISQSLNILNVNFNKKKYKSVKII